MGDHKAATRWGDYGGGICREGDGGFDTGFEQLNAAQFAVDPRNTKYIYTIVYVILLCLYLPVCVLCTYMLSHIQFIHFFDSLCYLQKLSSQIHHECMILKVYV